jgi:hypothetical protein
MARRTHTYAIRLAVEGGGQVKAELITVGQSGEQSLKRIESAGNRASGGLKGLGRQAELLRAGVRTLGGALIGVTTVGGLAALVDRSISAADAIGKTADKIGVGVEALQELRFAAKASGVEASPRSPRALPRPYPTSTRHPRPSPPPSVRINESRQGPPRPHRLPPQRPWPPRALQPRA